MHELGGSFLVFRDKVQEELAALDVLGFPLRRTVCPGERHSGVCLLRRIRHCGPLAAWSLAE